MEDTFYSNLWDSISNLEQGSQGYVNLDLWTIVYFITRTFCMTSMGVWQRAVFREIKFMINAISIINLIWKDQNKKFNASF